MNVSFVKSAQSRGLETISLHDFFTQPQQVSLPFYRRKVEYLKAANRQSEAAILSACLSEIEQHFGAEAFINHNFFIDFARQSANFKALKAMLPAATVSGLFTERKQAGLQQHSNRICLDFDFKSAEVSRRFIERYQQAAAKKSEARIFEYFGFSASGTGVFAVVKIADGSKHLQHFAALELEFKKAGVKLDGACKDVTRLRFAVKNSEVIYDASAQVFNLTAEPAPPMAEQQPFLKADFEQISTFYAQQKTGVFQPEPGSRNSFCFRFALACLCLGIEAEQAAESFERLFGANYENSHNAPAKRQQIFEQTYKRYKERTGIWRHKLSKEQTASALEFNEFCSELLTNNIFLTALHQTNKQVLIQAPTGGGKTTMAVKAGEMLHKTEQSITVIAAPLNGIVIQQAEKNKVLGITARNLKAALKQITAQTECIFVNYDNAFKVVNHITAGLKCAVNLIIDEQHEVINSISYRYKTIDRLFACMPLCKRSIYLSATPFLPGFDGVYLRCERSKQQVKPLHRLHIGKRLKTAICEVLDTNKAGRHIVLLNNKKQIAKIERYLKQTGRDVKTITSETEQAVLVDLLNGALKFDVLLCTSRIATGIEIETSEPVNMLFCVTEKNSAGKIVYNRRLEQQFFARVRDLNMVTYTTVCTEKTAGRQVKQTESTQQYFERLLNYKKQQAERLNTELSGLKNSELNSAFMLPAESVRWYTAADGKLQANKLAVLAAAFEYEKSAERINTELQRFTASEQINAAALKQASAEVSSEYNQAEATICNMLQTDATTNELASAVLNECTEYELNKFICLNFEPQPPGKKLQPLELQFAKRAFTMLRRLNESKAVQKAGLNFAEFYLLILAGNKLKTGADFTAMLQTINALFLIEAASADLTAFERKQQRTLQQVQTKLLQAFNRKKRLFSYEIAAIINSATGEKHSSRAALVLAQSLLKIERQRCQKTKAYYYTAGGLNDLKTYILELFERFYSLLENAPFQIAIQLTENQSVIKPVFEKTAAVLQAVF